METPSTRKRRLNKAESSLAMLHDSSSSEALSQALLSVQPVPAASPGLTASVVLRRGRISLVTVAVVVSIAGLTLLFHHGLELQRFNNSDKTVKQQTQLLDDYNSYSGSVASALGKPVELFTELAVQVGALHAVASAFLRPETSWKARGTVMLASAVVGYLIGNSFNALNVQLRELPVQAVISSSDLSLSDAATSAGSSNVTSSVSESTQHNSIANTVLRTLVLPRATRSPLACDWGLTTQNFKIFVPNDVLEVGFPQREWMARLLPEALDAVTLRFTLNATNDSANAAVSSAELPMDASLAADLVVNTMFLSSEFIPWGKYDVWNDPVLASVAEVYPTSASESQRQVPTAALLGLLPADSTSTEAAKKEWLLQTIEPVMASKFADTSKFSLLDIGVEFAHVELASNVWFDSLTFELDVNTSLFTNATDEADGTRYTSLSTKFNCAPWADRCLFSKAVLPPERTVIYDLLYDAPVQVNAFAVCVNADGSETIESTVYHNESYMIDYNFQACNNTSTSSVLLVSVAKRLVADELISNVTGDADGLLAQEYSSVATNLRKIFSFTVGRLHWETSNLATQFNAECEVEGGDCTGLSVALSASETQTDQRLVIGVNALPLNQLTAPNYNGRLHDERQRPLTLLQVDEPPRQGEDSDWYSIIAGDVLLPHNVQLDRWDPGQPDWSQQTCALQEDRLQLVLNNHYYMEYTLQATYTSALFFLLQDAVTTFAITVDQQTTTLAFSANVQPIAVWISVPRLNTWLTLVGCGVLVAGIAGAVVSLHQGQKESQLLGISTPHVVARVMLDERTFPPELLHRQVHFACDNAGGGSEHSVDTVMIDMLSVKLIQDASGLVGVAQSSDSLTGSQSV
jgi:hypothetical protein